MSIPGDATPVLRVGLPRAMAASSPVSREAPRRASTRAATRRMPMNTLSRLATAFAAGAAAMYFLDPTVGRRRRALVRDKGVAARHDLEDYARATGKRAADHLQGAAAEARAQVAAGPVGDQRLHDRIRSGLGRMVERPGDVSVHVQDGRVVLMGSAS